MPASASDDLIPTLTRDIATQWRDREGPLLPILQAVQQRFGHIPAPALPVIADVLNLTRAEVHGVMSFYHDLRDAPGGRKVLKLCRGEACQAVGADETAARAKAALGIEWHETTPDGAVTLEPVYCLGLCACGPAAMLDDTVAGRIDACLDQLLDEARR